MRILVWTLLILLGGFSTTSADVPLELSGRAAEGGMMIGKTVPGARVSLDGNAVSVSLGGDFVIGFGRDDAGTKTLRVESRDAVREQQLEVEDRTFKIQRIDGLPPRKVTPDPADLARIKKERDEITQARSAWIASPYFVNGFVWPAVGRISGVYGSQRILNGKPRRPHFGTDIAAPIGTPVSAMADGEVVFVHSGMFFNGKTILIDHGLGLRSIYIHLSEASVVVGQRVKAGERIGAIGNTGRSTGPHLHFGLEWGKVPLDPELVLGPMPG